MPITADSGYLWFFDAANVETVFKVWFFAWGRPNARVTLTVADSQTSESKTYTNPQGTAFQPIQYTAALGGC